MNEFFATPDDMGEIRQSDLHASLGERLGAQAADALDPKNSASGMWLFRRAREANAGGEDIAVGGGGDVDVFSGQPLEERQAAADARRAAIPDTAIGDAKARVKQEGLEHHLKLPDQASIKSPVLEMMINDAHERRDREVAIAQGPQGFWPGALGLVTSLGVGMVDPVNIAAFSIPVIGEARMGKIMASAGDSILNRTGARVLQGSAQGAAGTALLQPADWWLHTKDGQDYTFADALKSVVMGAGMGAGFHAIGGGIGDLRARRRGAPLPGSPEDLILRGLMTGRHVPADVLHEDGVSAGELADSLGHDVTAEAPAGPAEPLPMHPAEVLADLPPAAQEDVVRAAIADVISDRPVRAAEVLEIAADHDPRIAESIDAWHGSPHDFERFDASRINSGEGAQSYGHGLYFAEKEEAARHYQRTTSDKAFVNRVAELYDQHFSPDEAWAEIKDHWKDFTLAEQRLMTALEKDDWLGFDYPHQAVSAALRDIRAFDPSPETAAAARAVGNMYRVRIKANPEHFVDWDRSFDGQTPHVQRALRKIGFDEVGNAGAPLGEVFKREMGGRSSPETSRRLSDNGIPGIRYLDRGSRGSGEHTSNFVVFDDKHIEITHKNGEPVELPKPPVPAAVDPDLVTKPKARGRAAAHPDTLSLGEHLASKGGLAPHAELSAIYGGDRGPFVPGFGPLIRKKGMTLDEALGSAKEHGYLFDPHDVDNGTAGSTGRTSMGLIQRDLLDALDNENRGQKLYKRGHVEATKFDPEQEKHVIMNHLEAELAAAGEDVSAIDPKLLNRTVEIMHREGVTDVLDAYERAIMEDSERYDAIANARQTDPVAANIPGFEPVDDGRAASGHGAADQGGDRRAGRPEPGRGRSDDPQSRGDGRGAAAASDPRWRELGDARSAVDDPAAVAESKAADGLKEPDSLVPETALTAAEKAAADAEAIWRKLEPTLNEEERTAVNAALDKLKEDKDARAKIITDGAACLAAAVM